MPKQVIVSMQEYYPFGECEECNSQKVRVLVRKIYEVSTHQRDKLLEKVSILRKLKNEYMIKIESVLEEEESIHFLFEYIPIKLQTWISNINDQFIENFRDQLLKFSSFLANNQIKIEFQLKNIGMDQNYGAKYFLDLNFEVDPHVNREKLKSTYIRQITNLFKPYIMSSQSNGHSSLDSDREKAQADMSTRQQKQRANEASRRQSAISPPTNKPNNSKNKQKALEKYYQDVNMSVDSQNEKILQEFMDVLDNQEEQDTSALRAPHKSKTQNFSVIHSTPTNISKVHNVSSNELYSHNQGQPNGKSNKNQSFSSKQIPSNQQQFKEQTDLNKKNQRYISQEVAKPIEIEDQNQKHYPSQSMGGPNYDIRENSEFWRSSADLQNRVKKAIEKSLDVIKKFKTIKDIVHN